MRISVVAVGNRMPAWVIAGVEEYSKRMPRELKPRWREIPLARRAKDAVGHRACVAEGDQILKAIPSAERVIALDVAGRRISTMQLSNYLADWQMSGSNTSVVIGGPDGLSPACLARADQCWSMSDLTLPHTLVRVLLAEQLYRAWTITANHPYHRA